MQQLHKETQKTRRIWFFKRDSEKTQPIAKAIAAPPRDWDVFGSNPVNANPWKDSGLEKVSQMQLEA